jgi:hypothetical protein
MVEASGITIEPKLSLPGSTLAIKFIELDRIPETAQSLFYAMKILSMKILPIYN